MNGIFLREFMRRGQSEWNWIYSKIQIKRGLIVEKLESTMVRGSISLKNITMHAIHLWGGIC